MSPLGVLKSLPLCRDLSDEALTGVAALTHIAQFMPGELLLRQGTPSTCAYALVAGQVAVLRTLPGGGELPLAEVGPGSVVGEMSLLAELPRMASARALDVVQAVVFDRAVFAAACRTRQPAARIILEGVMRRVCAHIRSLTAPLQAQAAPGPVWQPAPDAPPTAEFDYRRFLSLLRCAPALGDAGLDRFVALAPPRALSRGEPLFTPDTLAPGLTLVVHGALESLPGATSDAQAMEIYGPGSLVGLPTVLDGGPLDWRVRAREQSLVLQLPQATFEACYAGQDDFAFGLLRAVAEQLADSMLRLSNRLAQNTGLQRAQTILARRLA